MIVGRFGEEKMRIAILAVLAVVFFVGCSARDVGRNRHEPPTDRPPVRATSVAIEASDQRTDGTDLIVNEASLVDSRGFVVVYRDSDGAPGKIVGYVAIPEGQSLEVRVPIFEDIESGTYWAVLHVDRGEVGEFEFPGPDLPVVRGEDTVLMVQFTLTVDA